MDTILRNALLAGALSSLLVIIGGSLSLSRPLSVLWLSRLQVFAAGAVFGILVLELMPDLLFAHHFEAMLSFFIGLALTIAMKWITGKGKRGRDRQPPLRIATIEAIVYSLIAGILMGSGFVAGVREGLLLTAALTMAVFAISLLLLSLLARAESSKQRGMLLLLGLAISMLIGAVGGATLLWGRSKVDLDLLYAFGMAVILLWALEALVEAQEDHSPMHTLFFFFIGTMLFMFLAGWLGRAHADHPGAKQSLSFDKEGAPFRSTTWDMPRTFPADVKAEIA